MEGPDLVVQETGYPDHQDRVVSASRGLPVNMQQVVPTSERPFCYKVEQQTSLVSVTCAKFPGPGSGCIKPTMGGSVPVCLPTGSHLRQSGVEAAQLPMQENHCDCFRVAQHEI